MGFWSSVDRAVGGVLPGGPTRGEVRYRDTLAGRTTGTIAAINAAPFAIPGAALRAAAGEGFEPGDVIRGAYRAGSRGFNWEAAERVPDLSRKGAANVVGRPLELLTGAASGAASGVLEGAAGGLGQGLAAGTTGKALLIAAGVVVVLAAVASKPARTVRKVAG